MEVLNVKKAKSAHELTNVVEHCDLKGTVIEQNCMGYGIGISETIKTATSLGMCMHELRDIIVQSTEDVAEYAKVKEVVMNFIDHQKSLRMHSVTDIVYCEHQYHCSEDQH